MSELASPALMRRLDALAACSDAPDGLTRISLGPAHRQAAALLTEWMQGAGMTTRMDAIGNVIGRYEGPPGAPALLLGSHLDSVRNAGKYDGPLGIVAAIACVAELHSTDRHLPFAIEVLAFSDEEGVRFGTTLLGSRAVAGIFDQGDFRCRDAEGITLSQAIVDFGLSPDGIGAAAYTPEQVLAYVELHIEQGPVLERAGRGVGIVSGISGAVRHIINLTGMAGHAGTVPMDARRDALAAAAACILAMEHRCSGEAGLVGTVGCLDVPDSAVNVVPGRVRFTTDIRAPLDAQRRACETDVMGDIKEIAQSRGVAVRISKIYDMAAVQCAPWLVAQIAEAVAMEGVAPMHLASGAGHDGLAMHKLCDIGMIFVRCADGISHSPAEAITAEDAELGARVLARFIDRFHRA